MKNMFGKALVFAIAAFALSARADLGLIPQTKAEIFTFVVLKNSDKPVANVEGGEPLTLGSWFLDNFAAEEDADLNPETTYSHVNEASCQVAGSELTCKLGIVSRDYKIDAAAQAKAKKAGIKGTVYIGGGDCGSRVVANFALVSGAWTFKSAAIDLAMCGD